MTNYSAGSASVHIVVDLPGGTLRALDAASSCIGARSTQDTAGGAIQVEVRPTSLAQHARADVQSGAGLPVLAHRTFSAWRCGIDVAVHLTGNALVARCLTASSVLARVTISAGCRWIAVLIGCTSGAEHAGA